MTALTWHCRNFSCATLYTDLSYFSSNCRSFFFSIVFSGIHIGLGDSLGWGSSSRYYSTPLLLLLILHYAYNPEMGVTENWHEHLDAKKPATLISFKALLIYLQTCFFLRYQFARNAAPNATQNEIRNTRLIFPRTVVREPGRDLRGSLLKRYQWVRCRLSRPLVSDSIQQLRRLHLGCCRTH